MRLGATKVKSISCFLLTAGKTKTTKCMFYLGYDTVKHTETRCCACQVEMHVHIFKFEMKDNCLGNG